MELTSTNRPFDLTILLDPQKRVPVRVTRVHRRHLCARFFKTARASLYAAGKVGDDSGKCTPVPIPNTEVKLARADGTNLVRDWESRSLPVYFKLSCLGK